MNQNEKHIYNYLESRLVDYITFKPYCDLDWIKRKLRNSNITPEKLKELFNKLHTHKNTTRYQEIFEICRRGNFNSKAIK